MWNELIRTAFLGTERSPLASELKFALRERGFDLDDPPEVLLLEGLAIFGQYRKVAQLVQPFEGTIMQSPATQGEACSAKSAKHLEFILKGDYGPALDEFIHYLKQSKKSVPPEALPELLEKAVRSEDFWQKIQPILGPRGQWLMQQHPDWKELAIPFTEEAWEVGTRQQRCRMLLDLRQQSPQRAIEVLRIDWIKEGAAEKRAFLEVIAQKPDTSDRIFLEECLLDRHKDTRQLAARMLARLPDTDFRKRLQERAALHFVPNKKQLEVIVPNEVGEDWQTLGVEVSRNVPAEKAGLAALEELLKLLSPVFWAQHLTKEPIDVLEMLDKADHGGRWHTAIIEATLLHQDKEWADALVRWWLANPKQNIWQNANGKKILALLSNTSFNEICLRFLNNHFYTLEEDHLITQLLCMGNHRWEDKLTLMIVRNMQQRLSGSNAFFSDAALHYFRILKVAAYHCNPKLLDTLKTGWLFRSRMWNRWEKEVENFLRILSFRKEMIKALTI